MMTTTTTTAVIQCNQSTLRHGQETDRYCCFLDDKWDSLSTADWVAQSTNQQEQEQRVRGSLVGWYESLSIQSLALSRSATAADTTPAIRESTALARQRHEAGTREGGRGGR